jgi:hypothetical protein
MKEKRPKKPTQKLVAFRLDQALINRLKRVATLDGIPQSEQLRRALASWLSARQADREGSRMNYTQQKLWEAVRMLASGTEPIRQRLNYAGMSLAILNYGGERDAAFASHPDLQRRFDAVMQQITAKGSIEESTRVLPEDEARKVAQELFDLFCAASDLASIPVGFHYRDSR